MRDERRSYFIFGSNGKGHSCRGQDPDAAVKALERAAGLCGGNRMCDGACEKNIRALADRVKSGEETP